MHLEMAHEILVSRTVFEGPVIACGNRQPGTPAYCRTHLGVFGLFRGQNAFTGRKTAQAVGQSTAVGNTLSPEETCRKIEKGQAKPVIVPDYACKVVVMD